MAHLQPLRPLQLLAPVVQQQRGVTPLQLRTHLLHSLHIGWGGGGGWGGTVSYGWGGNGMALAG